MQSERYTVTFFGVDTKYYTNEFVAHLWEDSANREYEKSHIFITGLFDMRRLVCGKIRGCELGDTVHLISVIRNPAEAESVEQFLNSLKQVVREVREQLGHPSMTLTTENVEFHYFLQVNWN